VHYTGFCGYFDCALNNYAHDYITFIIEWFYLFRKIIKLFNNFSFEAETETVGTFCILGWQ
jgi:hypothetical protein